MLRKVLLPFVLVVVGCGSVEPAAPTFTSVPAPTTTTTAVAIATTTSPTTTATMPQATTTTTLHIDVEFAGGEVIGPDTFPVALGDTVDIWVLSDVDDEMHIHGYDLLFDLEAGVPFNLTFVADIPGIFEVEVHTGHTHLFDIEVSG